MNRSLAIPVILFFFTILAGNFYPLTALMASVNTYNNFNPNITITSFNTRLDHSENSHHKERLSLLIKKLKHKKTDVICLQEVWSPEDRDKIVDKLNEFFPFYHYATPSQNFCKNSPACKYDNLFQEESFFECNINNCLNGQWDNNCRERFLKLLSSNRNCASAILASQSENTFSQTISLLNPFSKTKLLLHDGNSGVLLLSKLELRSKRVIHYTPDSTLKKRVALSVEIKKNDQIHRLYCTHLSSNSKNNVPYFGKHSSWKKENESQIKQLLADSSKTNLPTFLVGNFNCSIANPLKNISGELEDNCKLILKDKFYDPFIQQNTQCSLCKNSTYVDHIFIKNAKAIKMEMTLKDTFEILNSKNIKEKIELSDHYGVRMQIKPK